MEFSRHDLTSESQASHKGLCRSQIRLVERRRVKRLASSEYVHVADVSVPKKINSKKYKKKIRMISIIADSGWLFRRDEDVYVKAEK
jgi:hypothetical protein